MFDLDKSAVAKGGKIEGHSVPLAALGGFLLIVGFFSFNGGSLLSIVNKGEGMMNEWNNEWINEWMNQKMIKLMNEWMNEWTILIKRPHSWDDYCVWNALTFLRRTKIKNEN